MEGIYAAVDILMVMILSWREFFSSRIKALSHKSGEKRSSPFPRRT